MHKKTCYVTLFLNTYAWKQPLLQYYIIILLRVIVHQQKHKTMDCNRSLGSTCNCTYNISRKKQQNRHYNSTWLCWYGIINAWFGNREMWQCLCGCIHSQRHKRGGGAVHKNTFVMAGCTLTKTAGCLLWQFSIIFEANCYVYTLYSVFDTHFIKNITFTISQRDTFS